jgi:rod shape determining protein RodA
VSDHASPWGTPRSAPARRRQTTTREIVFERVAPVRAMDWWLQGAVMALMVVGGLLVWSATKSAQTEKGLDPAGYLKKDILNVAIGLSLGAVTARIDYRSLRAYAPIVYGLSLLGLVVVLSPLGVTINGAHSWIELPGGFEIQPSEFAKIALIVGIAMILGEKRDGESAPRRSDVLLVLGLAAVPMVLIMGQPDFGTMMVLVFIILGTLALSGVRARYVVGFIVIGALLGFGGVQAHLLKTYQVNRLTAFAHENKNVSSTAYNVDQAKTAIGAGGLFGTGLFNGSQTNGGYVPEQETDFIFTAAGEQFGFVGSAALLLLLGMVLWRGTRIAAAAGDSFGMLMATGVVAWFAFQTFVNVGMTMGIMPVTGLPLPFVSYGGSSLFANMIAIGLLQNVHAHTNSDE